MLLLAPATLIVRWAGGQSTLGEFSARSLAADALPSKPPSGAGEDSLREAPMNSQGRCAPWIPRVSVGSREKNNKGPGEPC